jgi:predicted PurR-regulated permease PerM
MSRTTKLNPLLVLLSFLVGTSIGGWVGGFFGSFVAALLSIPVTGAFQVIARNCGRPPHGRDQQRAKARAEPERRLWHEVTVIG